MIERFSSICKAMARLLFTLAAFSLVFGKPVMAEDAKPAAGQWISLFNGKDLTGWTPKIKGYELGDNFGDTFRVEDGVIKVSYDQYNKFDRKYGHIFYKDKFSHYRSRIEYRFVGEQCPGGEGWATRNSGVMLHCQPPDLSERRTVYLISGVE